ncbi:hypothetical protein B9T31_15070 [Acinetobacter sp. ANC 4558]|uniref:hypothetical protein n=1 Tax=Acinetobacter sp. ANC 4558 TaxID=1977876 RepID=UPI000A335F7D|nr:hypothetical protein [Acinetobacter sp. ANC 4558]OTG81841.1 hypothetical protein B9T31_15070 [Acinetobacter sp. ANC 4558]
MDIKGAAWNIAVNRVTTPPKDRDPIVREIALKKYVDNLTSEQDRIITDFNAVLDYLKGFVLVPREPTQNMMIAALAVISTGIGKDHIDIAIIQCWKKMIEAYELSTDQPGEVS